MSTLREKVLNECMHEHGRSAKNLARRLGVKRPAVFSVLFSLRAESLVTSSTGGASTHASHNNAQTKKRQRLLWTSSLAC